MHGQRLLRRLWKTVCSELLQESLAEQKLRAIESSDALPVHPRLEGKSVDEKHRVHHVSVESKNWVIVFQ